MNRNDSDDNEYWGQQERQIRELRESLPEEFKAYIAQQITDYLNSLSPEDKNIWVERIGNHPILQRVIYYVFSPLEEIDLRLRMLAKNDIDVDFDMKHICFVQALPEINQYEFLRIYLRKLAENFLRVFTADCQKKGGMAGSFEELRKNCLRIEKTDGGRKTIMDHSPWTRYELLKTTEEKSMTIYALDKADMPSRFNVDPFLIGWMQTFDNRAVRDEAYTDRLEIRIVDVTGNLVKPPKGYINPFFFSLRERYIPLLKKAFGIFQSPGIIEYEDIESCFFMVLKKSQGYINPQSLYWEIRDLAKQRNKKQKIVPKEEAVDDHYDPNIDEPVDDAYVPSTQRFFEATSTNDPLQILVGREIIETAKGDDRFWNLIASGKPKTPTERQYIHRIREKLKKL